VRQHISNLGTHTAAHQHTDPSAHSSPQARVTKVRRHRIDNFNQTASQAGRTKQCQCCTSSYWAGKEGSCSLQDNLAGPSKVRPPPRPPKTHLDVVRPCHVECLCPAVLLMKVQLAVVAVGVAPPSWSLHAAYKLVHVGVIHLNRL
jgi:hypothetical protein